MANATPASAVVEGRSPRTSPAANVNTAIAVAATGAITDIRPQESPVYMQAVAKASPAPATVASTVTRMPPRGCEAARR